MCPFEPPNPNELIEIRRRPFPGHGVTAVGTYRVTINENSQIKQEMKAIL